MKPLQRTLTAALSALVVAGTMAVFAPAAHAAPRCTRSGAGILCVDVDPRGYAASYRKAAGPVAQVRFSLRCAGGVIWDDGSFSISRGQTRSYTFAVGSLGACFVRLTDVDADVSWDTPPVTR